MVCGVYMMAFYGLYAYLGTHLRTELGVATWVAGLAPLVYGLGFGAAAWVDPVIDRLGMRLAGGVHDVPAGARNFRAFSECRWASLLVPVVAVAAA